MVETQMIHTNTSSFVEQMANVLKDEISQLALENMIELGKQLTGSENAFTQAAFNQMYRQRYAPGTVVTRDDKLAFAEILNLNGVRGFNKLEGILKTMQPRYDANAPEYAPGSRAIKQTPKKAAVDAIMEHTCATSPGVARTVGGALAAVEQLAYERLAAQDGSYTRKEAFKLSTASRLDMKKSKGGKIVAHKKKAPNGKRPRVNKRDAI